MTQPAVRDFINVLRPKYQACSKPEKKVLLNTCKDVTGLNRKHLIKRLNEKPGTSLKNRRTGRPKKYDYEDLKPHILYLWAEMGYMCPRLMQVALKEWLKSYKEIKPHLKMQLLSISCATLSRYLAAYKKKTKSLKD